MLVNQDFEQGFHIVNGIGELSVADGWRPWWNSDSARPEYKDAAPFANRLRNGQHAQQWFNTFNTHTAGVYQVVTGLTPGARVLFSAWVQCWSSGENDPAKSKGGRYRMRIGIEPYGATDPESVDMVWSNDGHAIQPYDAYYELTVAAVLRSDRCTCFVWGQPEWPVRNNNAYVDNCTLEILGSIDPGPDPEPGTIDYGRVGQVMAEQLARVRFALE